MQFIYKLILCVMFVSFPFLNPLSAQELEPRRWSHVPVDSNFIGAAYAWTDGDIFLDPVLRVEDGTVEADTVIVSYLRSFDWMGKTARFDVRIPYQHVKWQGILNGEIASAKREGLDDPRFRLSVNFLGAPALKGEEFKAYRASRATNTIVGTALAVTVPLGDYYEDKLLNLGQNRFIVRPQLGAVHSRGPWSFELTGSVFFYTDNNEYWDGKRLEQEPLFVLQSHIVHTFSRGMWASVSAGYDWGGQSTVNGEKKNDQKEDLLYALSFGMPVSKKSSIKIVYANSRTRADVGSDTDNIAVAYSHTF